MKSVCESTFTQGEMSKYVVRGTFTSTYSSLLSVSWCTMKITSSMIDSAHGIVFLGVCITASNFFIPFLLLAPFVL
jgi:hypothetical protein